MIDSHLLPRLTLAFLLVLYGLLLRLGPRRADSVLPLPWAKADSAIAHQTNQYLGILLVLWGAWLVLSLLVSFTGTQLGMLLAPLILIIFLTTSHSARLYVHKYETFRVERVQDHTHEPIPKTGGWLVVILRELLPMAAFLVPTILIQLQLGDLPDRIPVRISLFDGPTDWRFKHEALALLRQQTRFVYLVLLLAEAGYLIWKWAGKTRGSLATRLISRSHWRYFFFRTAWIAVYSGIHLGCAAFALRDQTLVPYIAPGMVLMAGVGFLTWWDQRKATYLPPRKPSEP